MTKIASFDTETTGLWKNNLPPNHVDQPHLVQLGLILEDLEADKIISKLDVIIRPDGWTIPPDSARLHGITQEIAEDCGVELVNACWLFRDLIRRCDVIVAHNFEFDQSIINRGFVEAEVDVIPWSMRKVRCTKEASSSFCRLAPFRYGSWKWPSLEEAFQHFFGRDPVDAHTALADAESSRLIHRKLCELGAFRQ